MSSHGARLGSLHNVLSRRIYGIEQSHFSFANLFNLEVRKAGGERWKSMCDAKQAPFIQKAEKRKSDYGKSMNSYNKRLVLSSCSSCSSPRCMVYILKILKEKE